MKKLVAVIAAIALLSTAAALSVPARVFLPFAPYTAKASFPDGGGEETYWGPEFGTPTPRPSLLFEAIPFQVTTPTPKPVIPDGGGEENVNRTTPKPTNRQSSGGGKYLTSEGPLFLSFRRNLTDEYYMFTPMDLSVDGEYRFPLVGSTSQVVGEAKIKVISGLTIVTYSLIDGVKLNERDEFFTFFPDIRSVETVKPSQLKDVKLEFGVPYSVTSWLDSDSSVLLYINCPISYSSNLNGLEPFSFEDPAYLKRMVELVMLMD